MKKHQIKLIDNTYSLDEGKELLMALINDKIKFLNMKVFSLQERFGSDTSKFEQRIAELKEEKNQLQLKLKTLENSHDMVEIDCHVHLKIKESEHLVV
jgi:uncharacterized protein (DUF342 family)